ncbi:MAG: metallophosphoesterase, partial [Candidatus Methanomethylicaceae archaeon]
MKIGFLGDLHFQVSRPPARIDNWEETLSTKLQFLKTLEVDLLIFTGDLCTQRPLSLYTLNGLIQFLGSLPHKKYSIVGNHDLVSNEFTVVH